MSSRHQITDSKSFEAFRHPAFVQAVNRAANLKCLEAIRSGKLRVVAPQPISSNPSEYTPRMDFIDDPAESHLSAVFEIPGIKTNDISLHILDGHLVVSGERRPIWNTTQQSEALLQDTSRNGIQAPNLTCPIQELRYASLRRSIQIPEGVRESDINACLKEGMPTVTWPRRPAAVVHKTPFELSYCRFCPTVILRIFSIPKKKRCQSGSSLSFYSLLNIFTHATNMRRILERRS